MKNFREHRMSPYQFWMSPIDAEMNSDGVSINFDSWDKEAEKYLDGYKFNAFKLPLLGMGGGTFYSRHYGEIAGFKQGTPEYLELFREYGNALVSHLKEKGWLEKAYAYWFDEPKPDDYDFVREGMELIGKCMPGLARMLTEQPVEELQDSVDLWCPILNAYNADRCQERQRQGEEMWWYVCTGPKAPYPGLFIDRDAIEMRIWLWMTQKYGVEGILVWQTNYWTSGAAYPEEPQNPWQDPMGYQSGYGFQPGHIGYWGNGDGRFLYPANKDVNSDKTEYLRGPVNSIRWEMLREGLEDVEYFKLLEKKVAEARARGETEELLNKAETLLKIGDDIVSNLTRFTRDPNTLLERREQIAEMIETLGGRDR